MILYFDGERKRRREGERERENGQVQMLRVDFNKRRCLYYSSKID